MYPSRRTVLKTLGFTAAQYRSLAGPAPSDRIRVGFIGLGGMGTGRLNGFLKHEDVTAVALCDLDQTHLDKAVSIVEADGRPRIVSD